MVRGVLFDSGGTLVGPRGGRWNPRFDFEEVLSRHHPHAPASRLAEAISAGEAFIQGSTRTVSRDAYHRVVLAVLDLADPTPELLAELDAPLALPVLEAYPETEAVLAALAERNVPMCIVSDNWIGLERLYEQLGLARYFKAFIISEALGCAKPDPRMYRAGADALGLKPAECLFVDDSADLVRAAIGLGYAGAHIARGGAPSRSDVPVIAGLWPLLDLVPARSR